MSKKEKIEVMDIFESCAEIIDSILTQKSSLNDALELLEYAIIVDTLNKVGGNNTQAAKKLGINRTTFVMKSRRLSILKEKLPIKLEVEITQ